MARAMPMNADAQVYRVAITKQYRGQESFTAYEGPYATAAAARARLTFWKNHLADLDMDIDGSPRGESWATGHVELGTVSWSQLG